MKFFILFRLCCFNWFISFIPILSCVNFFFVVIYSNLSVTLKVLKKSIIVVIIEYLNYLKLKIQHSTFKYITNQNLVLTFTVMLFSICYWKPGDMFAFLFNIS